VTIEEPVEAQIHRGRHRRPADDDVPDTGFLAPPERTAEVEALFAHDLENVGYVMNLSHAWGHLPDGHAALFALLGRAAEAGGLGFRQRGVLVSAAASTLEDPHCALAWGTRLATEVGEDAAAAVLRGEDLDLPDGDQALARWARQLAADPGGAEADDVQALRDAGYDDAQIFAITLFVALRIAFSTVNDALGARPNAAAAEAAPPAVRETVTYGRPIAAPDAAG